MAVGVDADLLELLVTHFQEDVDGHLFALEDLAQVFQAQTGQERGDSAGQLGTKETRPIPS